MEYDLELSDHEYAVAFRTFKENSNERDLLVPWLETTTDPLVSKLDRLSILSVGSIDEEFDFHCIRTCIGNCRAIKYHVVDPFAPTVDALRNRIDLLQDKRLDFSTEQIIFEDYKAACRFDLVHFMHSLIYIENPLHELLRALDMTKRSLLVVTHTQDGIPAFRSEFLPLIGEDVRFALSNREVTEALDRAGYSYDEVILQCTVEVSACFQRDSAEGRALLNFLLLCRFENLDPETSRRALQWLSEQTVKSGANIVFRSPVSAIEIRKSPL